MEFLKTTYGKVAAAAVALVLITILMVSCSRPAYQPAYTSIPSVAAPAVVTQAPAVVATPAPVVVQGGGGHSTTGDAFMGSLAGTMVGNALSGPRNSTTIVERHTVVPTTTAPAQRYGTPPLAQRYVPPTTSTQTITNNRGITTTTTQRPSTFGSTQRQSISVGRTTSGRR